MQQNNPDYYIICGDFNLVLNPKIDSMNYKQINKLKATCDILNILDELNLVDCFQSSYPGLRRYTWRRPNPLKQAFLDYFLTSSSLTDLINKSEVKPGYQSDHSFITLEIIETNLWLQNVFGSLIIICWKIKIISIL